jgi:hypothetical protein
MTRRRDRGEGLPTDWRVKLFESLLEMSVGTVPELMLRGRRDKSALWHSICTDKEPKLERWILPPVKRGVSLYVHRPETRNPEGNDY